jgi:RNA polymerase sigma-70 factor, ECF subfamily
MEPDSSVNDESLVLKIAQGDQAALSTLYSRYAQILYSFSMKSLGLKEESEEVIIDVFAQVWRLAERYEPKKARVDTWLFMLTRSRILDRLRKRQRSLPSPEVCDQLAQIQSAQSSVDPIEGVLIAERRERVIAALKVLPPEQRLVIELAYYQGLTQSEIVKQTGLSLGTVKTRVRLGLNKLRTALS